MSDLISRQVAIDAMKELCLYYTPTKCVWHPHIQFVIEELEGLPSAERTGRWTHVYDENEKLFFRNKWVCSECGKSNTYGMPDFCPHCGAMMENSTRRMKEAGKIKCLT